VSPTSVQPVKRFSLFQALSPWRSRTIFFMLASLGCPVIGRRNGADAFVHPKDAAGHRRGMSAGPGAGGETPLDFLVSDAILKRLRFL
jgi:hypothetical protein